VALSPAAGSIIAAAIAAVAGGLGYVGGAFKWLGNHRQRELAAVEQVTKFWEDRFANVVVEVRRLNEENGRLQERIGALEQQIQQTAQQLQEAHTAELAAERSKSEQVLAAKVAEYEGKLSTANANYERELGRVTSRYHADLEDLEQTKDEQIAGLRARVAALEAGRREAT
jgi:chromosome segregation ATPase